MAGKLMGGNRAGLPHYAVFAAACHVLACEAIVVGCGQQLQLLCPAHFLGPRATPHLACVLPCLRPAASCCTWRTGSPSPTWTSPAPCCWRRERPTAWRCELPGGAGAAAVGLGEQALCLLQQGRASAAGIGHGNCNPEPHCWPLACLPARADFWRIAPPTKRHVLPTCLPACLPSHAAVADHVQVCALDPQGHVARQPGGLDPAQEPPRAAAGAL